MVAKARNNNKDELWWNKSYSVIYELNSELISTVVLRFINNGCLAAKVLSTSEYISIWKTFNDYLLMGEYTRSLVEKSLVWLLTKVSKRLTYSLRLHESVRGLLVIVRLLWK